MIDVKELRIGNWIRYVSRLVQVAELRHDNVITTTEFVIAGNEYFEAEPITPEILEACGFIFNNDSSSYRIFSHKKEWILAAQETLDKSCFKIGLPTDRRSDQYMTSLTNLHQLQNLYFSLTGKELTYSPNTTVK